jgi:hypothetical protein
VGSLKMNTTLEYSTRVVQEGDRRCKKSTLNDLASSQPERNRSKCRLCVVFIFKIRWGFKSRAVIRVKSGNVKIAHDFIYINRIPNTCRCTEQTIIFSS